MLFDTATCCIFIVFIAVRSSGEATSFVRKIQSILRHLDVCDGIMAEGSLRCDVNISIRPKGSSSFGERVEIKNLNSLKSVEKAIKFERSRQIDLLKQGKEGLSTSALLDFSYSIVYFFL